MGEKSEGVLEDIIDGRTKPGTRVGVDPRRKDEIEGLKDEVNKLRKERAEAEARQREVDARQDDLSQAILQIGGFFSMLAGHIEDPCLRAYKRAEGRAKQALSDQAELDAAVQGIVLGLFSAAISGCLGGLVSGCLQGLFTKHNPILLVSEKAQEVIKGGAVEIAQKLTEVAISSAAAKLASSTGVDLSVELPVDLRDPEQTRGRIHRDKGRAENLLSKVAEGIANDKKAALDKLKSDFNITVDAAGKVTVSGGKRVGPLQALAIKLSGNREKEEFKLDGDKLEEACEHLANRIEIGMWWQWLVNLGPADDPGRGFGPWGMRFYRYCDQEVGDWSWATRAWWGGTLPYHVQIRLKALTKLTPPQINEYIIPHFDRRSGKLKPGQAAEYVMDFCFPGTVDLYPR